MKFHVYRDSKHEFRWRLVAKNGRIIADSGEGYKRKSQCTHAISRIMIGVSSAQIVE